MDLSRNENNHVTFPLRTARVSTAMLAMAALALLVHPAAAQRYSAAANPDSPEGQFLELISLQSDEAKKLELVEQFTQRFPRHPAVSWAYEQLQLAAVEARQWDKVLAFGERLAQLRKLSRPKGTDRLLDQVME